MCPGLTEVVVFGGMEILSRTGISKTSVLQFGELLLLYTHVVNRATIFGPCVLSMEEFQEEIMIITMTL